MPKANGIPLSGFPARAGVKVRQRGSRALCTLAFLALSALLLKPLFSNPSFAGLPFVMLRPLPSPDLPERSGLTSLAPMAFTTPTLPVQVISPWALTNS
jgi:hypothetical protein